MKNTPRDDADTDVTRRAATPTIALAIVSLVLQAGILVFAPAASPLRALVGPPHLLDYAPQPFLGLPALTRTFVASTLGRESSATPTPSARPRSSKTPTPSPKPTPSPSTSRSPLIPAAQRIRTFMRVSKTEARTADFITYDVIAHNDGAANFTGEFIIATHTPLGSTRCGTASNQASCTFPGDYDGTSKDPNDSHLNPPPSTRATTVNARSDKILLSVVVQITSPPGTVLHNHAHVSIAGSGMGWITSDAPDVTVIQ